MVPEKRTILAICGALAVAFALPGCAPTGYNAADYGSDAQEAQPAANAAQVEASPSAQASDDEGESEEAPELADEELTKKLIGKEIDRMGNVVTDEEGWTLYLFTADVKNSKKSTCVGDCAEAWPPALTDGDPDLDGISSDLVGTITRDDGSKQLTLDGWPLYRFANDKGPGKWKGQCVGGKWFVIQPSGKKNLECLPKNCSEAPAAPKPPADGGDSSSDSNSSGGGYSY